MNYFDKYEKLSTAVSLSVLEIDYYTKELIPAFLLANLMSPSLWKWRLEKNPFNEDGELLSTKNRLNQIQRFFHHYTFTILQNEPGGDAWGLLNFCEEEKRFGYDFINTIRNEYDATFKELLKENPTSQFGQIINESYYKKGLFPRLKNEIFEVMNAFSKINEEGKGSGKCIGLGMLWAAALIIWGRFPIDRIIITGNRAHMFVYLDVDDGHLFNNTKWFSRTRINNQSKLSEFTRIVTSGKSTTFFYSPKNGMCHCSAKTTQMSQKKMSDIYTKISSFVSNPIMHPLLNQISYVQPDFAIPDPLEYDSAQDYQNYIKKLAEQHPNSIYEFALYSFRLLKVPYLQVYIFAALRDYHVKKLAKKINKLSDAILIIEKIIQNQSIFNDRNRIALPDEVLYFKTGNDRDKSLLLFTLLHHSLVCDNDSVIGFSNKNSFVCHKDKWIDINNLEILSEKPTGLDMIFNKIKCEGIDDYT